MFRNRKGFWALIAQGFCDANTRFAVFDVKWPGNTYDIIAYNMTDIYHKANSGQFPSWATFVLDEAYSSCGGMHLTPFSVHQRKRAKRNEQAMYYKMPSFVITKNYNREGIWYISETLGYIMEADNISFG